MLIYIYVCMCFMQLCLCNSAWFFVAHSRAAACAMQMNISTSNFFWRGAYREKGREKEREGANNILRRILIKRKR